MFFLLNVLGCSNFSQVLMIVPFDGNERALHREYKFKGCLYSVYFENVIDMRRFIIGLKQTWIAETGGVLNWQCNYIGKVHPNVLGRVHKLLRI